MGMARIGAEDEGQHRQPEDAVVHHKADGAPDEARDDHGVDVADVVADKDRGAFFRNVVQAPGAHAVSRVDKHPGEKAHQEFRHQQVDVTA